MSTNLLPIQFVPVDNRARSGIICLLEPLFNRIDTANSISKMMSIALTLPQPMFDTMVNLLVVSGKILSTVTKTDINNTRAVFKTTIINSVELHIFQDLPRVIGNNFITISYTREDIVHRSSAQCHIKDVFARLEPEIFELIVRTKEFIILHTTTESTKEQLLGIIFGSLHNLIPDISIIVKSNVDDIINIVEIINNCTAYTSVLTEDEKKKLPYTIDLTFGETIIPINFATLEFVQGIMLASHIIGIPNHGRGVTWRQVKLYKDGVYTPVAI